MDTETLEEYYPNRWRKTKEKSRDLQEQEQKVAYAKKVADEITQEQFEKDMVKIHNALKKCKELAFSENTIDDGNEPIKSEEPYTAIAVVPAAT